MQKLQIDPEFRDKIPPLTEAEFQQLRENILADGEVYEPIAVWNGTIVDGHNRWRIIQEHPEIPYKVKEMDFADKWAAFEWMYRNQLGRRNLTEQQREVLIGEMYKARKRSHGASDGFRGNQYSEVCTQNGNLPDEAPARVSEQIARELGIAKNSVIRAERFTDGISILKDVSPEAADKVMSGNANVTKDTIRSIPKMEPDEVSKVAEDILGGEKPKRKVKGWTKEDRASRALTEAIVADMLDPTTVPEFTLDFLIEDIQVNGKNYVDMLRSTLTDRSNLLTQENKPKIAEAIEQYVIAEIKKVKELVNS